MGWVVLIGLFFIIGLISSVMSLKDRIQTSEGLPMIDMNIIQLEDVPIGVSAVLKCTQDELIVTSSGYNNNIKYNNIIDITLETSVGGSGFSLGKAVTGTLLLGGVGAVAGVSSKKEVLGIMVSYKDHDDKVKYMVFSQKPIDGKYTGGEKVLIKSFHDNVVNLIQERKNDKND